MRRIPLSRGKYTIVDDEDFEWLSQWKWSYTESADKHPAAYRQVRDKGILMHRLILNAPEGLEVDHKNMRSLDNRRSNLRLATRSQNAANRRLQSNNTTGYRGVYWDKSRGKWLVMVKHQNVQKNLGRYDDKHEAARVYNSFAVEAFGEFARLNEIPV